MAVAGGCWDASPPESAVRAALFPSALSRPSLAGDGDLCSTALMPCCVSVTVADIPVGSARLSGRRLWKYTKASGTVDERRKKVE